MGSDAALTAYAWTGVLVLLRVGPIVLFSPAFGGAVVPKRFRVALAFILSATLALQTAPAVLPSSLTLVGLAVKEIVIGVTMAVTVTLVFDAFAMAGALVDQFRGVTSDEALDPTGGEQTSAMAAFYKLLALVLFLSAGGYQLLLQALVDSLQFLPLTTVPDTFHGTLAASDLLTFFGRLLVLAVQISAPVLLLSVVTDVAIALLSRLSLMDGVQSLGPQVKAPLGVLICLLSLSVAVSRVPDALTEMLKRIAHASG
ncbi:MAG: flagellar biosynthetic protein FliR [Tepidisphaeraceae bacterium]